MRYLALLSIFLAIPVMAQQPTNATASRFTTSATLPATCSVGAVRYKTGASAGQYNCTATNTWTIVATGVPVATTWNSIGAPTGNLTLNMGGFNTTMTNAGTFSYTGPFTLPNMTAGSVIFAGAGGLLDQDNANFFYTDSTNLLTLNNPSIGTTPTDSFIIKNTTAATAGATLQYSPALRFTSAGWDTNDNVSRAQDWRIFNIPTSTAAPRSSLSVQYSDAGGAFGELLNLSSQGIITAYNDIRPSTAVTYQLGTGVKPWLNIFTVELFGPDDASGLNLDANNGPLYLTGSDITLSTSTTKLSGKITQYNLKNTVSNGVPALYATTDLTAQAAAIGATTLYAVPASSGGMYRVCYNAKVTTVDAAASILGGATGFRVIYTDADDSVVVTTSQGSLALFAVSSVNTTQAQVNGCIPVNAKASTNIQYTFGYTSTTPGEMKYSLHAKVEAM